MFDAQSYVHRFNGKGYDKVHLFELVVGDRFQVISTDGTVRKNAQGDTDFIVTAEWEPVDQKLKSKPYKSESQLFDEVYEAYKKWPNNGGPNWSGNSPSPWEAFLAGYRAALNK